MPSVFINYRRADSGASAGRLTDDLKEQLRGVRVFRDVAEIHPGEDFRWTLEQSRAAVNKAIQEARARRIRVYLMPRGFTAALRRAWLETRAGLSGSDGTFSRLQASMAQFEDAAARPIASAYGL